MNSSDDHILLVDNSVDNFAFSVDKLWINLWTSGQKYHIKSYPHFIHNLSTTYSLSYPQVVPSNISILTRADMRYPHIHSP